MWEIHLEWYLADVNLRSQPVVVRISGKGIAKGGVKLHARAFQIAEDKQLPKCTAWTVSLLCSKACLLCIWFIIIILCFLFLTSLTFCVPVSAIRTP